MRILPYLLVSLVAACGGAESSDDDTQPAMKVEWAERTCEGPYAEAPYAADRAEEQVFFGGGRANVPVPPVFDASRDTTIGLKGLGHIDLALDGTPEGVGATLLSCGTESTIVSRVVSRSPLVVERQFTWRGTRTTPCDTSPTPPPSACRVVQRITYAVDAPR